MARNNQPMSIEAMLDMERKEVLALLENRTKPERSPDRMRASSPYTPRSPVRSMLDVGDDNSSKPASPRPAYRSMLDVGTSNPPPSSKQRNRLGSSTSPIGSSRQSGSSTTPNSPVLSKAEPVLAGPGASSGPHVRSFSDASSKPVEFGPRASVYSNNDPTSGYQFSGILTQNYGHQMPKRNTQGGKKNPGDKRQSTGALAEALRGADLSNLQLPGDRGRSFGVGTSRLGNKSKSPHSRLGARSPSPAVSPMLPPNKALLDDGRIVDISNAYRRLSDANLAFSSGSLAQLPMRKRSEGNGGRLVKDYLGPDGEELGSSDDDEPYSSDDEDRGRKKAPRSLNPDAKGEDGKNSSRSRSAKSERKTLSLLAAAEEERK